MKIKRIATLVAAFVLLALLALPASANPPASASSSKGGTSPNVASYFYDFELTLAPWVSGAGASLSRQFAPMEPSSCDPRLSGTNYADLKGGSPVSSGSTDYYAYMETGFPASSAADKNEVTVKFDDQSINGCVGCKVSLYVGNSPVTNFVAQANGLAYLTSYWVRHGDTVSVTVNNNNAIYVALGWVGTPAANTGPNVGFDCINVDIGP
ncbi:MAG TPA: hypothetical protein VGE45_12360 [Chloroflexia bacterium]|jgi:hypothetical protein